MHINKLNIPDRVLNELPDIISKYEINTNLRLAHFLAQVHHESAGFNLTDENLNYSVKRLLEVFPKYFKSNNIAKKYAYQPMLLASYVYGNRMGNGDESTGDGWKYKGRGYIQLTGKNNYMEFDKQVHDSIIDNPDLVSTKYPLLSAGWYWDTRKLNHIADLGAGTNIVKLITKQINGGLHGLDSRCRLFMFYFQQLNDEK